MLSVPYSLSQIFTTPCEVGRITSLHFADEDTEVSGRSYLGQDHKQVSGRILNFNLTPSGLSLNLSIFIFKNYFTCLFLKRGEGK